MEIRVKRWRRGDAMEKKAVWKCMAYLSIPSVIPIPLTQPTHTTHPPPHPQNPHPLPLNPRRTNPRTHKLSRDRFQRGRWTMTKHFRFSFLPSFFLFFTQNFRPSLKRTSTLRITNYCSSFFALVGVPIVLTCYLRWQME